MRNYTHIYLLFFILTFISCSYLSRNDIKLTEKEIDHHWENGITLPLGITEQYPLNEQLVLEDTGINILVDMAHQTFFSTLYNLPASLNKLGFRAIGSQSVLHAVLKKNGNSRVRIPYKEGIYPFAWIKNPNYNIILTQQGNPDCQPYMNEEIKALKKFVSQGGGLAIQIDSHFHSAPAETSYLTLLKTFDCELDEKEDVYNGKKYAAFKPSDKWEVTKKGNNGRIIEVRCQYENGYIYITGIINAFLPDPDQPSEIIIAQEKEIKNKLIWLAQGKSPVGGDTRLPRAMAGGGGIYPEIEKNMGDIVLLYTENQNYEFIDCVNNDLPNVKDLVESWFPLEHTSPIYLVLVSGDGAGWLVNLYKPKEAGVISIEPTNVLDVFSFEMGQLISASLYRGNEVGWYPFHDKGNILGGWVQGKIRAVFDEKYKNAPNRLCNQIFEIDKTGKEIDLSLINEELRNNNGRLTKIWYIFQKLDDRYGTTWYPRWLWVMNTRWEKTPEKHLTFDEMVEDMSIAVGEDLFPFFIELGTSLTKTRLEEIEFNNEVIRLKKAPLTYTPAGNARLESINDYKQPIITISK